MPSYQYFTIPYHLVPSDGSAPYTVWYATWTTKRPIVEPGMPPPIVTGATAGELPAGAIALAEGTKNPPPPPLAPTTIDLSSYKDSIRTWIEIIRDADE
jgi:hypothetical protein